MSILSKCSSKFDFSIKFIFVVWHPIVVLWEYLQSKGEIPKWESEKVDDWVSVEGYFVHSF